MSGPFLFRSRVACCAVGEAPLIDYEQLGELRRPAREQRDSAQTALAIVAQLSEAQRTLLQLRFYEGLTQSEIAEQLGISHAAPAMASNGHGHGKYGDRFVYTETQDPAGNAIVVYKRAANGALTEQTRVPTGGKGATMTPPFGFPIVDSQGSVELTRDGKLLFAVNAGDDTISAFKVNRNGGLKLVDRKSSAGDLPISIDTHERLLYVVNSLSGNITGFRFTGSGKLKPIAGSTEADSAAAGTGVPAQIGFAPNGRVLTVTLRGTQTVDSPAQGLGKVRRHPRPAQANHSSETTRSVRVPRRRRAHAARPVAKAGASSRPSGHRVGAKECGKSSCAPVICARPSGQAH